MSNQPTKTTSGAPSEWQDVVRTPDDPPSVAEIALDGQENVCDAVETIFGDNDDEHDMALLYCGIAKNRLKLAEHGHSPDETITRFHDVLPHYARPNFQQLELMVLVWLKRKVPETIERLKRVPDRKRREDGACEFIDALENILEHVQSPNRTPQDFYQRFGVNTADDLYELMLMEYYPRPGVLRKREDGAFYIQKLEYVM